MCHMLSGLGCDHLPIPRHATHQQNQAKLDNLDRAGQRSIEPQRLQTGAVLCSSVQYSAKAVQLCQCLSVSVGVCADWPKMEIRIIYILAPYACC